MKIDFKSTLEEKVYFTADHCSGCWVSEPTSEWLGMTGKQHLLDELNLKEHELIEVREGEFIEEFRLDRSSPEDLGYYTFSGSTFEYERGPDDFDEFHLGGIMEINEVIDFFCGTWELSEMLIAEPYFTGYSIVVDYQKTWAKLILGMWEWLSEKDFNELDEDEQETALSAVEKAKKILENLKGSDDAHK